MSSPERTLRPGDMWTPTRSGSQAQARTIVHRLNRGVMAGLPDGYVFFTGPGLGTAASLPELFHMWARRHAAVRTRVGG